MGDTAAITASAQAAGGAAGAYSQYKAGQFNSKVDLYNAKVADLESQDAIARGELAVKRHAADVARLKGAQRAALASQGVVVNDANGTSGDIITDTDTQAAQDEKQIRVNASLEAWGYQVQATDYRSRAQIARYSANNDAAGSLLTTVGRFNDTAYKSGMYDKKPLGGYSNSTASTYRLQGPAAPAATGYDKKPPVY